MLTKPWLNLSQPSSLLAQWLCPSCGSRLSRSIRRASTVTSPKVLIKTPPAPDWSTKSSRSKDDYKPQPILRPLGQSDPPKAGENSGVDNRTWRERREDFFNYEKHLDRRKRLTTKMSRPYFRDWTRLKYFNGKQFLSQPKLFKAEAALYFPNFRGYTLQDTRKAVYDTTKALKGKLSIVSFVGGRWAENQVQTFVGQQQNPALEEAVRELKAQGVQRVQINYEDDAVKATLVWLFCRMTKNNYTPDMWPRVFFVRKGVEDEVKISLGQANGKVGYVYLVDRDCKIRWAGSGDASQEEREGLVKVVKRLVEGVDKGREKVMERVAEKPPKIERARAAQVA
ncbi:Mitochondrial ATPase complex subunit atp10 [Puttea exsequens]|nr:Mitochondrial ATPase complex subunit atp10 [Puttea exsequens]